MREVEEYLSSAVAAVERKWGEGAAEKYPQIVAALITAGAQNGLVAELHGVADALREVSGSVGLVGDAVSGLGDK